jgi:type I restriction enzyme S subunit
MRPYLCAINILWDKIDFTTLKQTRFEESELERYTVRKGDLLICEGGEIGRAAIWDKDYSIQYQNALHRVRFTDGVAPRFCLYFFMHLKKSGILDGRYGKGVTIKHLVKSSLMSIPIPVAPIENQLSIVAELDKINELMSLKKAQLSDLDILAQSIFYYMFGDPIENEKGWEVKKLGEMSSVKTGPFGSMLHKEDYISNGIPLVNPIHIKDYRVIADMDFTISDEKARELNAYILRKNDVIFARRGDIGRCAVISDKENGYLCGTGSLFVRFEQKVIPQYIMYIIRSSSFIKELISKAKGATMLNLNSTTIAALGIPLPPLSLQQEFAKRIELIEQQKAQISSTIKDLETLLASRMQYWFD